MPQMVKNNDLSYSQHTMACETWLAYVHSCRKVDKKKLLIIIKPCNSAFSISPEIISQIYSVVEHLKALGWGEELNWLDDSVARLKNHSLILKACQKDLTKKGKFFVPYMQLPSKVTQL